MNEQSLSVKVNTSGKVKYTQRGKQNTPEHRKDEGCTRSKPNTFKE